MPDRLDSRRLRRALTVLLLFLSQLAAIAAAAQPACPRSACEDEASVAYAAAVPADAPVDQEDHPPACQIVASTCSVASPCVQVVADAGSMAEGISDDLVRHEPVPVSLADPPPYRPPRT